MKKLLSLLIFASLFLTGCAHTVMDTPENNIKAKQFSLPAKDQAGLYIYRDSIFGSALKKNLYVDDKYIGESAPKVFFYQKLKPGNHKISTESEFSDNHLTLQMDGGKNYFVRQYIKMGVFVGGANLEQVSEETGKKAIKNLNMALSK